MMIKRIAAAGFSLALLAGAAMAQSTPPTATPEAPAQTTAPAAAPAPAEQTVATPADANECLKTASDLAQSAEDRKLGDDKLDRIDDLLTKMEVHCDARQFVEAMAVAKDIKGVIEVQ